MSRQSTLLIVGCGDVGLRILRELARRGLLRVSPALHPASRLAAQTGDSRHGIRVLALTSSAARAPVLRAAGAIPLLGDLDQPQTLGRLAGLADAVLHLAPPPTQGHTDPRLRHLLGALSRRTPPASLVYVSTSGVYGDCQGQWVHETRPIRPQTDRARRRADAEACVRAWGRRAQVRVSILRVPGIYALDRAGADPRERVRARAPVLASHEDGYTNHIHADDLARIVLAALHHAWPMRAFNTPDDSVLKTGDYYDQVALACGLPPMPRITRQQAHQSLSPMQMSFWAESRRLSNARMKAELGVRLIHPNVQAALQAAGRGRTDALNDVAD